MKLHILFGHREERYEGEHAPEPLLCWSEHEIDENSERFQQEVKEVLETRGKEFAATRMFVIRVDADEIVKRLYAEPEIAGHIS